MNTARLVNVFLFSGLLILTLILDAESAGAAEQVRWYLQNVRFEDGSTASGFFDFDNDYGVASWEVTTTETIGQPGTGYFPLATFSSSDPEAWANAWVDFHLQEHLTLYGPSFGDPQGRNGINLYLSFDSILPDAGGTVGVGGDELQTYFGPSRLIVSGEVTSLIPELSKPVSLALGLTALLALKYSRRVLRPIYRRSDGHRMSSPAVTFLAE